MFVHDDFLCKIEPIFTAKAALATIHFLTTAMLCAEFYTQFAALNAGVHDDAHEIYPEVVVLSAHSERHGRLDLGRFPG